MKTVLFVPGFRENLHSRNYQDTIAAIESKGYQVVFVPITWARTTIVDWVSELNTEYDRHDPTTTVLAGFSFGSMTAFMAAIEKTPSALWLFSFSPYFSDDIPEMKKSWLANIGHRRADSFRKLDFNTLAPSITCETLIVVGEAEIEQYPLIGRRSELAQQKISHSRRVIVKGAGHDVSDQNYVAAISDAI